MRFQTCKQRIAVEPFDCVHTGGAEMQALIPVISAPPRLRDHVLPAGRAPTDKSSRRTSILDGFLVVMSAPRNDKKADRRVQRLRRQVRFADSNICRAPRPRDAITFCSTCLQAVAARAWPPRIGELA